MMKIKNVQGIIILVIFLLFANHALASDWILYGSPDTGKEYYDKGSIQKVNKHIVRVWTKKILSKKGEKELFSILKSFNKAPDNPNKLHHNLVLQEIDCVNEKYMYSSVTIYDEKDNVIASEPKSGEWDNILPDTVTEALRNIVCDEVYGNMGSNHPWAADWVLLRSSDVGKIYYDKSNIEKINKNITRVWNKKIYNEDGKKEDFLELKRINKAPDNADLLNYSLALCEIGCVNGKYRVSSFYFYDEKSNLIYSTKKSSKWVDVISDSIMEDLKNIVCSAGKTSKTEKK